MASPIEPTPILYGEDAKRLIADVEAVNKKLEDPIYRKKAEAELERCEQLYLEFSRKLESSRKGNPIAGDGCCLENS